MTRGLRVEGLGHAYGPQWTFRGVDFCIEPGEFVALLGASGSGKSTLLRALGGFIKPQEGRILLGEKLLWGEGVDVAAPQRQIGIVFQDHALFGHMSVRDNIGFGLFASPDPNPRIDELLALLSLEALGDRMPGQLSGGQAQRVALARALAPRPPVLLLDEPFANLDASLRQEVGAEIRRCLKKEGVAGVMVTHDRAEALALADQVGVLGMKKDGEAATVLQWDTPQAIYQRPTHERVARLTGEVNVVPGESVDGHFICPLGKLAAEGPSTGPGHAAIRPESILWIPAADGPWRVKTSFYRGAFQDVLVSSGDHSLLLNAAGEAPIEAGQRGRVEVRDSVWVMPG